MRNRVGFKNLTPLSAFHFCLSPAHKIKTGVRTGAHDWSETLSCGGGGFYAPQNCARDPLLTNDYGYEFMNMGVSINSIVSFSSIMNRYMWCGMRKPTIGQVLHVLVFGAHLIGTWTLFLMSPIPAHKSRNWRSLGRLKSVSSFKITLKLPRKFSRDFGITLGQILHFLVFWTNLVGNWTLFQVSLIPNHKSQNWKSWSRLQVNTSSQLLQNYPKVSKEVFQEFWNLT